MRSIQPFPGRDPDGTVRKLEQRFDEEMLEAFVNLGAAEAVTVEPLEPIAFVTHPDAAFAPWDQCADRGALRSRNLHQRRISVFRPQPTTPSCTDPDRARLVRQQVRHTVITGPNQDRRATQ